VLPNHSGLKEFSTKKYEEKLSRNLLLDVPLIVVLVIAFELFYGVLNFLDELVGRVLHNDMTRC
jgi:hypothetical protein